MQSFLVARNIDFWCEQSTCRSDRLKSPTGTVSSSYTPISSCSIDRNRLQRWLRWFVRKGALRSGQGEIWTSRILGLAAAWADTYGPALSDLISNSYACYELTTRLCEAAVLCDMLTRVLLFLRNQVFANAFWSGDRRSIVFKERTEGRIIWIITTRRPRSLNHTSHQTIAYLHRLGLIVVPISTCWPSWVVRIHKRLQLVRKMLLSKLQAIVAAMINQTNAYLIAIRMFLDTIVNQSTSHRRLC